MNQISKTLSIIALWSFNLEVGIEKENVPYSNLDFPLSVFFAIRNQQSRPLRVHRLQPNNFPEQQTSETPCLLAS